VGRIYEATWGRCFAACYDRFVKGTEEAGLRDVRREVLTQASGRTIDLGAGTGVNLDLFPGAVTELVLAEPDRHMASRLRRRLAESRRPADVVEAPAERLPFEDASFDTAVFTLVLCTVPDPAAALAETARVLRPGGRMLFIEHVRSDEPRSARWQDRLERPWGVFAKGCHPNRDTVALISSSPFELEGLESGQMPKAPSIVRPIVRGAALRPLP
jgi:ubiquinone/menaquinone biosynthesis C-methylase UbiE